MHIGYLKSVMECAAGPRKIAPGKTKGEEKNHVEDHGKAQKSLQQNWRVT